METALRLQRSRKKNEAQENISSHFVEECWGDGNNVKGTWKFQTIPRIWQSKFRAGLITICEIFPSLCLRTRQSHFNLYFCLQRVVKTNNKSFGAIWWILITRGFNFRILTTSRLSAIVNQSAIHMEIRIWWSSLVLKVTSLCWSHQIIFGFLRGAKKTTKDFNARSGSKKAKS